MTDASDSVRTIAREITTVGELRRALESFMDETILIRSVSLVYFIDLQHGSKIRIREE